MNRRLRTRVHEHMNDMIVPFSSKQITYSCSLLLCIGFPWDFCNRLDPWLLFAKFLHLVTHVFSNA